jgi:hypothetical protein
MSQELGPLAGLAGIWEGDKGTDVAPDDTPTDKEINKYRERMTFEPTGLVANHAQKLYGLRYTTMAWRLGADDPFHEEVGYWLWDAKDKQVLRCFIVPRGIALIAGGSAEADASAFELAAELDSPTYGICSNRFLDREFKTVSYALKFEQRDANTIHYWEDTVIQLEGVAELFHHTDENTLTRKA